ncbi:hypothetical protein [Aeromicrobium sp. UC242_57]|uniref:hypothetical protein n=1 Tax=Aeromicrobium sp. UC242_57 TaxID=3374624 RepID=UPI003796DD11
MRSWRPLLVLLAGLVMTASGLSAAVVIPTPGSITGSVTVPAGYHPRDVQVTAVKSSPTGAIAARAWVESDGTFRLDDVPPGEYAVGFGTYDRDLNIWWHGQPAWWTAPGSVAGTCVTSVV